MSAPSLPKRYLPIDSTSEARRGFGGKNGTTTRCIKHDGQIIQVYKKADPNKTLKRVIGGIAVHTFFGIGGVAIFIGVRLYRNNQKAKLMKHFIEQERHGQKENFGLYGNSNNTPAIYNGRYNRQQYNGQYNPQ